MSSLVACIGFSDPSSLAALVRDSGEPFHELSSTRKWQDASGALLLLDRTATYARPSFATPVRAPYRNLTAGSTGLAQISLTDLQGMELDRFTVIPDARFTVGWSPDGRVALSALGIDTEFFETAEDFFDSPRSSLPGFEGEPPAEVRQFGLPWPPTMEIETLLPSDKQNDPTATMSGTVQSAEVRTNSQTGHEFLVARVATVCGEIDLAMPVPLEGAPQPGAVVVGQVELHAAFPAHGLPDESAYTAPTDRISPNFRDGEPATGADISPVEDDDLELPEGLVLGEDGVVRTTEEHAAWKGGDADAGSRPAQAASSGDGTASNTHPEDEFDNRPEAPPIAPDEPDGVEATSEVAATERSAEPNTENQTDTSESRAVGASSADPDDDLAPREGETRREWRARTGRA